MSWKRWIAGYDLHGDKYHEPTVQKFLDFSKEHWKPHIKIFGGDLWDFRPLRGKANQEEKRQSMEEDYLCGLEFLKKFRPHFFLHGNHDWRLWDTAANSQSGPVRDLCASGIKEIESETGKMQCKMLPYDKRENILDLSHTLRFFHGFFNGITAVRQHANIYGHGYFGHIHAFDSWSKPSLEGSLLTQSVGALCQLDMDYNQKTPSALRHSNGWVYGVLNEKTGQHIAWMAKPINGEYVVSTSIKTL